VAKGRKTNAAKRNKDKKREKCAPGFLAKADNKTLRSYDVGAMPIINHIIRRMRLPDILKKFLPNYPRSERCSFWCEICSSPASRSMA